VISDLPRLKARRARYALCWMGHRVSDEITALLAMNRAHNCEAFRAALNGIGVPGQNILFASADGHIGQAIAAHLPMRPPEPPPSPLLPPSTLQAWANTARSTDLPSRVDPEEGFVASANNRPPAAKVLIGYFFSPNQRIDRIRAMLAEQPNIGFEQLAAMQRDVLLPAALPVCDRLLGLLDPDGRDLAGPLAAWDGHCDADSAGPLIFELLLYHLGTALHGKRMLRLYSSVWNTRGLLSHDLEAAPPLRLARAVRHALPRVRRDVRRFGTWGAMHRMEPRHVLATFPLLGRYFRFGDWPSGGSSDTVMKTAHGLTPRRHHATLASTARHLSDLSDVDANWFALLGGQDGWIGSTTMLDQTVLWRQGSYIQTPLRPETISRMYPHRMELHP
jgi:penicillin amidase